MQGGFVYKLGRSRITNIHEEFPLTVTGTFTLTRPLGWSRRDGRVVECACLESTCRRKPTGGSNPSLSATFLSKVERKVPAVALAKEGFRFIFGSTPKYGDRG